MSEVYIPPAAARRFSRRCFLAALLFACLYAFAEAIAIGLFLAFGG